MYRVSVSGYNLQFLRVSEPVFMSQRVFYLLGSILTVIASVLLLNLLLQSMIFAGLFILVSGVGAFLANKCVSDVREEK